MIVSKAHRLLVCMATLCASSAYADKSPVGQASAGADDSLTFKLTPSVYRTTHQADAADINLRANLGPHAVWLGQYQQGGTFEQTRSGYEYTAAVGALQLVPSVQWASHGFVGGSLNAQLGLDRFVLLGVGRTNLRNYYNLNFDPNDSYTLGAGMALSGGSVLSVFSVKDNRLHTDQRMTHLVWRSFPAAQQRLIVDLTYKTGRPTADDEPVHGTGLSVTYDVNRMFVRLARDQKVNFSLENQSRVSVGFRF